MDKTEDHFQHKSSNANAESPKFESAQATLQPPALQLKTQEQNQEDQEVEQLSEQPFQLAAEGIGPPPAEDGSAAGDPGGFKPNNTGLPTQLKSGVENLSGFSMDDVKVHYNSDKPAQLQAHAYAQGSDIHVASGQEKHLPHEAWHVVQQKQGRVQPTAQLKAFNINDDAGLEKEADVMGAKALLNVDSIKNSNTNPISTAVNGTNVTQRLIDVDAFKAATDSTQKNARRKGSQIINIDPKLEAYNAESGSVNNFEIKYQKLCELENLCNAYFDHKVQNMEPGSTKADVTGDRVDGINKLLAEITIEKPIWEKSIQAKNQVDGNQKSALHLIMEAKELINSITENHPHMTFTGPPYIAPDLSALTGQVQRKMGELGNRKSVMHDMILDDVADFEAMVQDETTDPLLKSVLVEILKNKDNIHFQETPGRASGAVIATDKDRDKFGTGENKYRLDMQMDQPSKDVRQSSLLHEMIHIATQEAFENTAIHIACKKNLSVGKIVELSNQRTVRNNALIAALAADKDQFSASQYNVLEEKTNYPINGANTLDSYRDTFYKKNEITEEENAKILEVIAEGGNNTLVEYDTVMTQMYFLLLQWGIDPQLSFFKLLKVIVQETKDNRDSN